MKEATPLERVAVPSVVLPSLNVTVPVAVDGVTVAVNVTLLPLIDGLTLDTSDTELGVCANATVMVPMVRRPATVPRTADVNFIGGKRKEVRDASRKMRRTDKWTFGIGDSYAFSLKNMMQAGLTHIQKRLHSLSYALEGIPACSWRILDGTRLACR